MRKTNVYLLLQFLQQPYTLAFCPLEPKLFCTGYYPDIHIIDPVTLETLLCLSSHVNPDWVSALHVLRPNKKLGNERHVLNRVFNYTYYIPCPIYLHEVFLAIITNFVR